MIEADIKGEWAYLSADSRSDILELIEFLVKELRKMEKRGLKEITVIDYREGEKK